MKPHFYSVKEEVVRKSRGAEPLNIQGNSVQVFADLSPYTVQKRRALKPLLQILTLKEISYRWSFPLHMNFSYCNKEYGFFSFADSEHLLLHLGLLSQELLPAPPNKGPSSLSKRLPPVSPLQPTWRKQHSKRSKETLPT